MRLRIGEFWRNATAVRSAIASDVRNIQTAAAGCCEVDERSHAQTPSSVSVLERHPRARKLLYDHAGDFDRHVDLTIVNHADYELVLIQCHVKLV
jgi:hypothetical protein